MINKFYDYYYFLSNFYPHDFYYPIPNSKGGEWLNDDWTSKLYKSVEHSYQAYKADNELEHEYIRNLDTSAKAKKSGKLIKIRENWDKIKYELMLDIIRSKFEDKELSKKLLNTGSEKLVEGNYWHDNLWGDCTCQNCANIEGSNWLGEILMEVRNELKNKKQ